MNPSHYTTAGTAVYEPSQAEYDDYLERRTQSATGLTVAEFHRAYADRELDEADPVVSELVALLRIGQNGR